MKNLFTLSKYFWRYRLKLLYGVLFIILSNAGTTYIPIIIKDSINAIGEGTTSEQLIHFALLIAGVSLVSGIFRFMIRQTIIVVSREIEYDLRGDFWAHIQRLPVRYFQNTPTGTIMAHATSDINAVRSFIGPAVMYSVDTGLRLILSVAVMMGISWELTVYSLLPLPLLSLLVYLVGKRVHARFTLIQEKFSELTSKAQEDFSGIRVIKSYVSEDRETETFKSLSIDYLNRNMRLVKVQALFQPVLFVITGLSVIIVIWFGGQQVITGQLQIGDIAALVMYLGILIWPMIAFGWVINIIQQAEASMKRLNAIFAEDAEIKDNERTDRSLTKIEGDIRFRKISFRYGNDLPYVLKDIDLHIPKGKTYAIMGYTGCGKTTLINLIPRLYDVSEGVLEIDGRDVRDYPLSVLRKSIGIVPQETFLFSDSIAANICYGLPGIDRVKMEEAAKIAAFDHDVAQFSNGFDTIIGERGITMSGGQKQRCSLARALATDPSVLILDDSFSAVDTHTEEKILTQLKGVTQQRTAIIISHRVSTVQHADCIIVLKDGAVAESGTHEELVELGGVYAELHYKQLLEEEIQEIN